MTQTKSLLLIFFKTVRFKKTAVDNTEGDCKPYNGMSLKLVIDATNSLGIRKTNSVYPTSLSCNQQEMEENMLRLSTA